MQSEKPNRQETARTQSLATTLITAFVSLTLVALFIAYVAQLFLLLQLGQQVMVNEQQLVAQEAARMVSRSVLIWFDTLETAARLGGFVSDRPEEREKNLANLSSLQPAFRQLAFLNIKGQMVGRVSRFSLSMSVNPLDRAERGWFTQLRENNRYISPVYVDEVTSEPLVIMAVPVTDIFGDFQGALLAEVNLKFMWDLVGRLEVGKEGLAYVVDRQGRLLAFGDISRVLRGENVGEVALVARFMAAPVSAGRSVTASFRGINGRNVVGTYVALVEPDWAVVVEVPAVEGLHSVIQSTLTSAGVVVAVALLAVVMAVYLSRRLSGVLLNLTTVAARIAEGEITLQAPLEGPTEVVNLAAAFNKMTVQLRETLSGLEQRVAERTRGLLTAAEVSRSVTRVLDLDELLPQVVELMRERFDLYYVGLFLLDETGQYAVLRAGSGTVGQQMLAQGWRLEVGGNSMIGRCVATGQADIQLDVGAAAVRFDNPYLPRTRSEAALPLYAGGRILGALSVQSDQEAFFSDQDIIILQTAADQIANAVRNAYLFQQLEASLMVQQRAYGELSREAWRELLLTQPDLGFLSNRQVTVSVGDLWRPEMRDVLQRGAPVLGREGNTLAVPIRVRDQVVGVIDGRKADGTTWTPYEIDLLTVLAEQLNVALESAQLYRDARRREVRERVIGEVTRRIRETLNVEAVLRTAVEEMRQALGLERLVVRLGTPDVDTVQGGEKGHLDVEQS